MLDIQSVAQEEQQLEVRQHVQQGPPFFSRSGELLLQVTLRRMWNAFPVIGGVRRREDKMKGNLLIRGKVETNSVDWRNSMGTGAMKKLLSTYRASLSREDRGGGIVPLLTLSPP